MLNHRGWITITFHSTPKPRNTKNHSPTSIFNIPLDLPSYPLYLWLLDHPYMGRKRLPGSGWQGDLFRKSSKTWGNLIGRHYGALGEGSTLVLMDPIFRGMPFGWKLWLLAVPSSIPSWELSKTVGCLPTPKFLLLPPPRWWTWTHDCLDNSRWPLSSIWETPERPFLPHQATVRQGLEFWPASRLSLNWARLLHEWSWALPTKGKVVSLGWMLEIPWSSLARAVHS